MNTGAAVFFARKCHYENQGKPVPEFNAKQSLMSGVTPLIGLCALFEVSRVPSQASRCMRGAVAQAKPAGKLPKP